MWNVAERSRENFESLLNVDVGIFLLMVFRLLVDVFLAGCHDKDHENWGWECEEFRILQHQPLPFGGCSNKRIFRKLTVRTFGHVFNNNRSPQNLDWTYEKFALFWKLMRKRKLQSLQQGTGRKTWCRLVRPGNIYLINGSEESIGSLPKRPTHNWKSFSATIEIRRQKLPYIESGSTSLQGRDTRTTTTTHTGTAETRESWRKR